MSTNVAYCLYPYLGDNDAIRLSQVSRNVYQNFCRYPFSLQRLIPLYKHAILSNMKGFVVTRGRLCSPMLPTNYYRYLQHLTINHSTSSFSLADVFDEKTEYRLKSLNIDHYGFNLTEILHSAYVSCITHLELLSIMLNETLVITSTLIPRTVTKLCISTSHFDYALLPESIPHSVTDLTLGSRIIITSLITLDNHPTLESLIVWNRNKPIEYPVITLPRLERLEIFHIEWLDVFHTPQLKHLNIHTVVFNVSIRITVDFANEKHIIKYFHVPNRTTKLELDILMKKYKIIP